MKKLSYVFEFFLYVVIFTSFTSLFTSCIPDYDECKITTCEYKLRAIDSYLSMYSHSYGSIRGSHFLGTGGISGELRSEAFSTSNIFCIIEDNSGTIQIKTIPSSKCDIRIITDSTARKVVAYRGIMYDRDNLHDPFRYLSASGVKDVINNNYKMIYRNNGNSTLIEEDFTLDTVQYFNNGKVDLFPYDNEYDCNHDKYDLSNDCTYYVFYVLEEDIMVLSELK